MFVFLDCTVTGCAKCPKDGTCEECIEGLALADGKCHCKKRQFLTKDAKCKRKHVHEVKLNWSH